MKDLKRVSALKRKAFEEKNFDGFLIMNEVNSLYFAGCPGLACTLISKKDVGIVFAYSRDFEQAKAETEGFEVKPIRSGEELFTEIAKHAKGFKLRRLAIDSIGHESYCKLQKELTGVAQLKIEGNVIWELRKVKDEKELELIRKASELTSEGVKTAYNVIEPGIQETEVAAEIEYTMRSKGSWGLAFDTIVASGPRGAYPHGGCTNKKIRDGELVVVDLGATYHYYRSDITRTISVGKPSDKQKKLYEIVRKAHEKAFQTIKSGAEANIVDSAGRDVVANAGYAQNFPHGLGHGVGLEVHEPPTFNQRSKDVLTVGNVMTDEPGIYFVGYGGIRIEDTVLVKKDKAEKLTEGPYTLETGK